MDETPAAVLEALMGEVRARRMTLHEALSRAFVCGLNAAVHAQQDRDAAESGLWLRTLDSRPPRAAGA